MYFFFQAEDGIRDLVRSRGLGDVYKRQAEESDVVAFEPETARRERGEVGRTGVDVEDAVADAAAEVMVVMLAGHFVACLLYTSDAADERSSVDLGGRRIIKKKKHNEFIRSRCIQGHNTTT